MASDSRGASSRLGLDDASVAGSSLVLAGVVAIMGIVTAEVRYPDYSVRQDISDLGSTQPPDPVIHQPSAAIFNGTMLTTGLLVLIAVYFLHRTTGRRALTVSLAAFGVGVFGVGVFPGNVTPWHGLFALLTFFSGGITVLLSSRVVERPFADICVALGGVSLTILVSVFVYGLALRAPHPLASLGSGGIERWVVYPLLCWVLAFGGYWLGRDANPDDETHG
jgi:hypothetical membrane protein